MEDNTSYVLKLYSPLTAELETKQNFDAYYAEPDMTFLDGSDLVYFQEAILDGIEQETLPDEAERGLMTYFHGSEAVDRKVDAIDISVEAVHGRLYGAELNKPAHGVPAGAQQSGSGGERRSKEAARGRPAEARTRADFATTRGEGFEQRPRATSEGSLYVHFWQDHNFSLCTRQELEQAIAKNERKRGDAR